MINNKTHKTDNTIIRLQLSYLFMIVSIFIMASISIYNVFLINNHMKVISEDIQTKLSLATSMKNNARERTLSLQIMVLTNDPFLRDDYWMLFNRYGARFADARIALLKIATSDYEKSILKEQRDVTGKVVPFQLKIADLATNEKMEEANEMLMEHALPLQNSVFEVIDKLYAYYDEQLKKEKKLAQIAYRNIKLVSVIVGVVLVLFALISGAWITKRIRRYQENLSAMNTNLEFMVENKTKELQESELRQKNIINNAVDGILSLNKDKVIQSINPAAQRMFGFNKQELIGLDLKKLMFDDISTDNKERDILNVDIIIDKEVELIGRRKDGSTLPLLVSFSENISDYEFHYSCFIRDITEQKRVEKLKNEFVSTVSHELRTPLTSIRGSIGLIVGGAMGGLPEKIMSLLKLADNNVMRLLTLINDLLDIQKIESGMMSFKFSLFDINQLLEQSVQDNRGYARQFNIKLEYSNHLNNAYVMIDSVRLTQVVTNLLSNAIKFSHAGGVVTLRLDKINEFYRVSVIDRGVGMSEEFKVKLFEKFTQEDSSSTRSKGGTGLGLNIAKMILENHKSDLRYKSKLNEGTEFYFDLHMFHVDSEK